MQQFQKEMDERYDLDKVKNKSFGDKAILSQTFNSEFHHYRKEKPQPQDPIFGGTFQNKQDFNRYV